MGAGWMYAGMLLVPAVGVLLRACIEAGDAYMVGVVARALLLAVAGMVLTARMVPAAQALMEKAQMFGYDINKKGTPQGAVKVPEALGIVPATIFIVILCLLHSHALRAAHAPAWVHSFLPLDAGRSSLLPHDDSNLSSVVLYTSALASVTFMTLLGFADDVLDLRWRYKMVLPLFGCMPLLANYSGSTSIVIPVPLRSLLFDKTLLDIGLLYFIYMALLSIFCTNAINIYAGINGLEAGQSFVIGCFILIHNAMQLNPHRHVEDLALLRSNNMFSVEIMLPFVMVTLGLLRHNWFPSRVFVGDTFCYFAGMTFAMGAILGHYAEILLLFFIPQLINFVYSLPQLIGIVPCPRHRLPKYNVETKKLEPIKSHLNLVNLTLLCTGPLTEKRLCEVLMLFQVACCSAGLAMRYLVIKYLL
ncbi:UDP-N-acetylglucosamine--dolichyl-phosphate N-acetylglucosaminephosphotransferase [Porphyridium purpureum]|uniref:UDP-N-acetylglucosamine--dolichyl-phosphate N-acetylglucosaminephosphotransferase n=1 Tax=Porphyridium purpureum TaxID=35688 RepID=A0A5J4Z248_PORPP|nr:UDP-N-acetylglucosamine--dolichyl-phosphate N-acetylglucosaminephosphotransferase [Porphyridium purpureum]|eukprot:POR7903..scf208_2